MRVLYVSPFYVPAYGFGGPVAVAHTIAKEMATHNSVTVLTTDALSSSARIATLEETIDGVHVFRFRNLSPWLAKNVNIYTPRGFASFLRKHIQEYEIVHLHAFFTYQNVFTCSQCRKHNIPFILHLHESPAPLPILGKVKIKQIFNALWGKRVLKEAVRILVVSGREKELLIEYMPELESKIQILPNPLPSDLPDTQGKRADYNLRPEDKVILSLSRLSRLKQIDCTIRALHFLIQHDPSYKLLIVGPDEAGTQQELVALTTTLGISDHVQFLGQTTPEGRAAFFSISDVYTLFSSYESFSVSTLESLYYKVPVCLSRNVGVAPDIIPANCGVMVEHAENAEEAAKAIQAVYENREAFRAECEKALQPFLKSHLPQLEKLYHSVTTR